MYTVRWSITLPVFNVPRGSISIEMHFFWRNRPVLHTVWHDDELARADPLLAIAELHEQPPFDHQEQLVFLVVMVPDKLALELD